MKHEESSPQTESRTPLGLISIVTLLIALGVSQCQSQNHKQATQQANEKIRVLEEQVNQLKLRLNARQAAERSQERRQPVRQAREDTPQTPRLSSADLDQYNKQISINRGLIGVYQTSSREYSQIGEMGQARESINKMARVENLARCLERYKSAAEPFYRANSACQAESANTRTPF